MQNRPESLSRPWGRHALIFRVPSSASRPLHRRSPAQLRVDGHRSARHADLPRPLAVAPLHYQAVNSRRHRNRARRVPHEGSIQFDFRSVTVRLATDLSPIIFGCVLAVFITEALLIMCGAAGVLTAFPNPPLLE